MDHYDHGLVFQDVAAWVIFTPQETQGDESRVELFVPKTSSLFQTVYPLV